MKSENIENEKKWLEIYQFKCPQMTLKKILTIEICIYFLIFCSLIIILPSHWKLILGVGFISLLFTSIITIIIHKTIAFKEHFFEIFEDGISIHNGAKLIPWSGISSFRGRRFLFNNVIQINLKRFPFIYFLFVKDGDKSKIKYVINKMQTFTLDKLFPFVELQQPTSELIRVFENVNERIKKNKRRNNIQIILCLLFISGLYALRYLHAHQIIELPLLNSIVDFALNIEEFDGTKVKYGYKWPKGTKENHFPKNNSMLTISEEMNVKGLPLPALSNVFIDNKKISSISSHKEISLFGNVWPAETIFIFDEKDMMSVFTPKDMKFGKTIVPKGEIVYFLNGKAVYYNSDNGKKMIE